MTRTLVSNLTAVKNTVHISIDMPLCERPSRNLRDMPAGLPPDASSRYPPAGAAVTSQARPAGLRARRREELIEEAVAVGRRHLVTAGAAGMSVRAIARDIGIAPSALYRYFPSRDALLTELIRRTFVEIDALLQAAVSRALAAHPGDPLSAWVDTAAEYRTWALAHSEEFSLVYGTPVPGYWAPEEATREVGRDAGGAFARPLLAAVELGLIEVASVEQTHRAMSPALRQHLAGFATGRGFPAVDLAASGGTAGADRLAALYAAGLGGWAQLQGLVAMELFGHLRPAAPHAEEYFRVEATAIAGRLVRAPALAEHPSSA